jgi:lipopolysaccharide biosynthesis regulator YciM
MQELIWLLLPVAALGGWIAATRSKAKPRSCPETILSPQYLEGLNYLLNEQPDKAIDVFIRMLEVTADTFETHLALGNLFRRRGEVDRAIRIHQNLIARESLSNEQRSDALLELGQDYMRAGLLDRAEGMFSELEQNNVYLERVLPLLLDIYQQEHEWDNAIKTAEKMEQVGVQPASPIIAQYYCELAEQARQRGDADKVRGLLAQAMERDKGCARASILLGDIEQQAGHPEAALMAYRQIEKQDIELLPEVLDRMYACHQSLGSIDSMIDYLRDAILRYNGVSPVLVLTELLARERGAQVASDFIAAQLDRRPSVRGLARFIELNLADCDGARRENLMILKKITDQLQESKPVYTCHDCGFSGKAIHWQCPGCKHWNTVKPIHGVEGE